MPIECPNCGTTNPDTALYCRSCGQLMEPLEIPEPPEHSPSVPEAVELGILANRFSRFLATIVDLSIIGGLYAALIFGFLPLTTFSLVAIAVAVGQAVLLTIDGQTVGKKALNIRIVRVKTGKNGGFVPNVMIRAIFNGLLGFIPIYSFLDILFIFRADRRCIHDLIAGTVVVKA